MERVAFILMHSEERISCLLNPDSFSIRRRAGIHPRSSIGGAFTSPELSDMPLIYTGGGITELVLDLLFDVAISGSTINTEDVRDLTSPLWELAENMIGPDGRQHAPQIRFIWGKSWNIPGVVVAVAEKFDRFTKAGSPVRSRMRLKMLRVLQQTSPSSAAQFRHKNVLVPKKRQDASTAGVNSHILTADERLDMIAARYLGDASYWRLLAEKNNIDDPLNIKKPLQLQIASDRETE